MTPISSDSTPAAAASPPSPPGVTAQTPTLSETFGTVMRRFREAANLTQTELAMLLAQSNSYVSLLEADRRRPTRKLIPALSAALHLSEADEQALTAAAGFPVDELGQAVQSVVDLIVQQAPADEMERELIRGDLVAQAAAWRDLLFGRQQTLLGDLAAADQHFATMAERTDLTPLLRSSILAYAANVAEKRGELAHAEQLLQRARPIASTIPDDRSRPLRAEIEAYQGMQEIRWGRYRDALKSIDRSWDLYASLPDTDPSSRAVTAVGLAKSANRYALLALLKGQPREALTYCAQAEEYLDKVTPSATDRRRLHLFSLRAWAYSQMDGHFEDARALHTQALNGYEDLHDDYNVAKQYLYLGDDYRQEIDSHLTGDLDTPNYLARRQWLLDRLKPYAHLIDQAETCYTRAIDGLKRTREGIMLSRGLRSLGEILRYQDILHPEQRRYDDAIRLLNQALSIESENGQGRRVPKTYESLAKLEWDRGALVSATQYYLEALNRLHDSRVTSDDLAAEALHDRCLKALAALRAASPEVRLPLAVHDTLSYSTEETDSAKAWYSACQELIALVLDTITHDKREPVALSDVDPKWLQILHDMELDPGPRLIAQKQLSVALSTGLPSGYPSTWASLHTDRARLLVKNLGLGQREGRFSLYRDLCCRASVERGVRGELTRALYKGQAEGAIELLKECPDSYELASSLYDLPLGFAVKGGRVYFEIPAKLVAPLRPPSTEAMSLSSLLCYQIEDAPTLATSLRRLFDKLITVTQASVGRRDNTLTWLKHLVDYEPGETEIGGTLVAAGAM